MTEHILQIKMIAESFFLFFFQFLGKSYSTKKFFSYMKLEKSKYFFFNPGEFHYCKSSFNNAVFLLNQVFIRM